MKQATASSDGAVPDRSMTQILLSDEEQADSIRRLVGMVMRRRGFIAAATVAMFLVASIAIMLAPREYTAGATIAVDPRKTGIVDIAAVISNLTADIQGIATEVQVLQAPSLVSRVLAKLSQPSSAPRADISTPVAETMMQRLSSSATELRQAMWGPEPMSASVEPEATDYDSIKRFLGHLTVAQLVHSRVIQVSYRSNDPGEAARIVNTLVDLYLADQVTMKRAATEEAHRWIDERLDGLRRGARAAEQSASDFRTEHHLNIGRNEVRLSEQQLIDLTTRLIQVRARRAHIDAQLGEAERLSEAKADSSAISGVLQSPTVSRLREQEAEVARELARGRETYGQNAPKMLELAAALADTEQKIKRETSRIVGDIRSQAAKVRGEEASIARAISDAESRIGAENGAAIQLRELEEQAGAQRQILKTFLERSNETGAGASYQAPDGRVVSYAAVPSEPSRPKIPLYFYLAFGAALCTATCLAFVRELLDDRIRSDKHILALGAAPLGMMPVVRHRTRPVHQSLAERPFSALGESIRGLVTSLFIHGTGDENVISVTSSLPGEGKTTVVMAIARLVAMTRHRVLVIDCDMHHPRLHRELGMTEQPGLAEVLAGKLSGAEAVIHDTATGIDLMPAGTDRYADLYNTGSFLLFYGRLHDFVASVRSRYDLVVIDCGPVLAVSDARVISHLADATVFVARWGQTRKAHAAAGLQQLRDARVNIAGVFLTMGNVKKQSRFSDLPAYHRLLRKYYLQ